MKHPLLRALGCALCLGAPLVMTAPVKAQTPAENNGRRAGEATLNGTVLLFDAAARALKIVVEGRAGQEAPSDAKAPFVSIVLPPDFNAPAALIRRGALVAATGAWAKNGALQARAVRTISVEEALTPPSGHIAPGWPQRVPGIIEGSAVAAQLDGHGRSKSWWPHWAVRTSATKLAPAQPNSGLSTPMAPHTAIGPLTF